MLGGADQRDSEHPRALHGRCRSGRGCRGAQELNELHGTVNRMPSQMFRLPWNGARRRPFDDQGDEPWKIAARKPPASMMIAKSSTAPSLRPAREEALAAIFRKTLRPRPSSTVFVIPRLVRASTSRTRL